LYGDRLSIA
jgi:hypothetical protein